MAAALYHGLIRRDGVLPSMLRGRRTTAPVLIECAGEPAATDPVEPGVARDSLDAAERTD
jgi:hypothetical protein